MRLYCTRGQLKNPRRPYDEEKSRVWEKKHLSTDAYNSTNAKKILLVRQNSPKTTFFAWQFCTLYLQKVSNLRPILNITFLQGFQKSKKFGQWTLGNGGKKKFKQSEQMQKKNL